MNLGCTFSKLQLNNQSHIHGLLRDIELNIFTHVMELQILRLCRWDISKRDRCRMNLEAHIPHKTIPYTRRTSPILFHIVKNHIQA